MTTVNDEDLIPFERLPRAQGPKLNLTPDEFLAVQKRIQHDFPTLDPMANYFLTYMVSRGATFETEPAEDGTPRLTVPDKLREEIDEEARRAQEVTPQLSADKETTA